MNNLETLKQNTKVLGLVIDEKMSPVPKLESIIALTKNLEILKQELSKEDYKEFEEIEAKVNKIIGRLTEPSFINSIIKGIDKLIG